MEQQLRDRPRFSRLAPFWSWEFARRHPAYLKNWQAGNRYWSMTEDQRHQAPDLNQLKAAVWTLWNIGVSGQCYPSPAASGHDLGLAEHDGLQLARPVTVRDLVQVLALLSPGGRKQIGALLTQGAQAEELLRQVEGLGGPEMDQQLTGLIRFNIGASTRSVLEATEKVIQHQKRMHGIEETRQLADDVYQKYLNVWDLREGFADGAYHGNREKRFRDIELIAGVAVLTPSKLNTVNAN